MISLLMERKQSIAIVCRASCQARTNALCFRVLEIIKLEQFSSIVSAYPFLQTVL